jgi:hypothetical protein
MDTLSDELLTKVLTMAGRPSDLASYSQLSKLWESLAGSPEMWNPLLHALEQNWNSGFRIDATTIPHIVVDFVQHGIDFEFMDPRISATLTQELIDQVLQAMKTKEPVAMIAPSGDWATVLPSPKLRFKLLSDHVVKCRTRFRALSEEDKDHFVEFFGPDTFTQTAGELDFDSGTCTMSKQDLVLDALTSVWDRLFFAGGIFGPVFSQIDNPEICFLFTTPPNFREFPTGTDPRDCVFRLIKHSLSNGCVPSEQDFAYSWMTPLARPPTFPKVLPSGVYLSADPEAGVAAPSSAAGCPIS